ncbi:TPM domain-containing protein, partial [Streptomyces caniscabiei]
EGLVGSEAVAPFTEAVRYAEAELSAAFQLRQAYDDNPTDASRAGLDEIVARCVDAGRRLDAEAAGFDRLRALEQDMTGALRHAEV